MSRCPPTVLLLLALLPAAVGAQDAKEIAAERERIAAERNRVDAEFLSQQKACYQRFAVTGCIETARSKRRDVMSDLRRQEIGLNDLERKQLTAERLRELDEKEAQQRRTQEERRAKGLEEQASRDQRAADKAAKAAQAASAAQTRSASAEPKRSTAGEGPDVAENQRRHDQRLEDAREHREKVEERAAKSGKAVKPLPVPP
jgi:colicin import membrane protein